MTGKFITFEGPDGSGKSSQMKLVGQALTKTGVEVVYTREPGGTDISESIRDILLDPFNKAMTHKTEALLYAAARAQHVEQKILPALESGKIVLCDRFVDSTYAYQGFGRGIDIKLLKDVNKLALGNIKPDLTLIFDINPSVGLKRITEKRLRDSGNEIDRIEGEALQFHEKVRKGFLILASEDPIRCKVIFAEEEMECVFKNVMAHVSEVV